MSIISNLVARFSADSTAFDRGTQRVRNSLRGVSSESARTSKALGSMIRTGAGMLGLGVSIYSVQRVLRSVVTAASDAEETANKFNVVFRDQAAAASRWSEEFGDKVGRSTQDVQKWMASLQDLFVPLGFAREEAFGLSKNLTQLAVDVASFNNQADTDVIRDFTSALVGNHEAVRKYGIIITESSLKQEALNKGFNKAYKELTNLEKVQLRYDIIQRSTTDAHGDAVRTADSYANQIKRLKGNYDELKVSLGNFVVPVLADAIGSINKMVDSVKEESRAQEKYNEILRETNRQLSDAIEKKSLWQRLNEGSLTPEWKGSNLPGQWMPMSPGPEYPKILELFRRQAARGERVGLFPPQDIIEDAVRKMQSGKSNIPPPPPELTDEQKAAEQRMRRLREQVDEEIKLTGRLNEPRQHARMMIQFQAEAAARYGENTQKAIAATKEFEQQLRSLERAEGLARIADEIGQAFSTAFEDMIFEARNLNDFLNALAQSIQRAFFQEMVSRPMSQMFSSFAGNLMGANVAHQGLTVGQPGPMRWINPAVFNNAKKYHGLKPNESAIIAEKGEVISRPGPSESGQALTINNVFNMQMIDGTGARQFFDRYSRQVAAAQQKEYNNNRGRR